MNIMTTKLLIRLCGLLSIILVSACTSHIPPEIKEPVAGSPDIAQVRENIDTYLTQKVRWGGVILSTENKNNTSWLTILAYPLSDYGEPQVSDLSSGRFIAIVDEFLEPIVYTRDRKVTVIGNIVRSETIKVGDYPYEYPVVQVEHHYLWAPDPEPVDPYYPPYWWYDPWYSPYYPWHHPYYPHYYP